MSVTAASPRSSHTSTTIYGDFTSASSYLASVRQDRLLARGLAAPKWCSVELRPTIPIAGIRLDGRARAARERELYSLRRLGFLGEVFDARVPSFIPSTRAAAVAYAEACHAGRGDLMRQRLFEAYWVHGADIGHPDVLARLAQTAPTPATVDLLDRNVQNADRATAEAGLRSTRALQRVLEWQDAWVRLGVPIDLTVVTPFTVVWGTSAVRALEADPVLAA
jgi:2-hydroxychromene-2-carboxylate isomerase